MAAPDAAAAPSPFHRITRAVTSGLSDLLFPPVCTFCDVDLGDSPADSRLCEACRAELIGDPVYRCRRCAAAVAVTFTGGDCPWCRDRGYRFRRAVAVGRYEGKLREAVLRLKRPGSEALSAALTEGLWSHEGAALRAEQVDLVAPIPMFWFRRLARGWNSPELTAARLAAKLGIGDDPRLLVRIRNTRPQAGLSAGDRKTNVHRAFGLRRGRKVEGKHVLLVDDVMTSGATCSEATRTLLDAGAKRVTIAVLARTQGET